MKKMRHLYKIILSLMIATMAFTISASAEKYIDTNQTGSITMSLKNTTQQVDVDDGNVEIYHVANIAEDEVGEYSYVYTEEFMDCAISLADPSDSMLPDMLTAYIDECGIASYASTSPEHGTASFARLPLGIYLVRNTVASEGYYEFLPFVATIPITEGQEVIYDVDASPKLEALTPVETETEQMTEEKTVAPTNSYEGGAKGGTVQTGDYMTYGMLMILMACVVVFTVIGLRLRKRKGSEN